MSKGAAPVINQVSPTLLDTTSTSQSPALVSDLDSPSLLGGRCPALPLPDQAYNLLVLFPFNTKLRMSSVCSQTAGVLCVSVVLQDHGLRKPPRHTNPSQSGRASLVTHKAPVRVRSTGRWLKVSPAGVRARVLLMGGQG